MEIDAVKTLLETLIVTIMLSLSINAVADIKVYQSTDNTGLNKQERIESVENYLIDLSKSLRAMEAKLDENAKKMGAIDSVVKAMAAQKAAEDKLVLQKLGEKKLAAPATTVAPEEMNDLEKLKADILILKNDDIEKLKGDFQELNDTVRALQATIKDQLEAAEKKSSKKSSTAK